LTWERQCPRDCVKLRKYKIILYAEDIVPPLFYIRKSFIFRKVGILINHSQKRVEKVEKVERVEKV